MDSGGLRGYFSNKKNAKTIKTHQTSTGSISSYSDVVGLEVLLLIIR
jgi:predicted Zn-dependent protease